MSAPMAITIAFQKYRFPTATAASAFADRWPTTSVSTTPMSIMPTWTMTTGTAIAVNARHSDVAFIREISPLTEVARSHFLNPLVPRERNYLHGSPASHHARRCSAPGAYRGRRVPAAGASNAGQRAAVRPGRLIGLTAVRGLDPKQRVAGAGRSGARQGAPGPLHGIVLSA